MPATADSCFSTHYRLLRTRVSRVSSVVLSALVQAANDGCFDLLQRPMGYRLLFRNILWLVWPRWCLHKRVSWFAHAVEDRKLMTLSDTRRAFLSVTREGSREVCKVSRSLVMLKDDH